MHLAEELPCCYFALKVVGFEAQKIYLNMMILKKFGRSVLTINRWHNSFVRKVTYSKAIDCVFLSHLHERNLLEICMAKDLAVTWSEMSQNKL